jgi:ketosteroid isomerase-like protein
MSTLRTLLLVIVTLAAPRISAQTPVENPRPASADAQPASSDTLRQSETDFLKVATLRQLETEFMQAAAERGSKGYMSYYAEDSVELPNGGHILLGKIAIAKTMGFLDDKNNRLIWKPIGADVSGDLGYTYGTYEFRSKDKAGKRRVEYGKYTSIWKKQPDGSWKVVLDMGNATPPAD